MKFDIQIVTDTDKSSRYTLYETWFNKKITIVLENRSGTDWEVVSSISLPKTVFQIMKPENLRANNETGVKDTDSSCSSFHHHTIGDRFELPSQVRQALFERDCEEIPLSENQLGYFSDLETLECFGRL